VLRPLWIYIQSQKVNDEKKKKMLDETVSLSRVSWQSEPVKKISVHKIVFVKKKPETARR
jgi:uncharacterized membrane protein